VETAFGYPIPELERMRREMDQMWRSFLPERPLSKGEVAVFGEWFPEFDLSETKDALVVKAEVQGFRRKILTSRWLTIR